MLRSTLSALVPFLLALPAAAQAPLKAGDRLPPLALEGLSQTEAKSFSDFYGRAVLIEVFAYWCGPCAASIPHVNQLQDKYGARGFSVLGVTTEGAKKTEPFVAEKGLHYAYGYDPKQTLHQLFQYKGIPFAVLVDPFGTIVWTGHPMALDEKDIETALVGAFEKPVWQWPAELQPVVQSLEAHEFATAMNLARSLPAQDGLDLPALVRSRLVPQVERFTRLVTDKKYAEAMILGEQLEKGVGDLAEGAPLLAGLKTLRDDPAIVKDVAAVRRLLEFEGRASALRNATEAEALRGEVAQLLKEVAGTKHERRAQALLDALDRALEKAKKKA
jgi:thiol-disulfide isomerase/thioredoxin